MKRNSYSFSPLWGKVVASFDNGIFECFEFCNEGEIFYFQYIKRDISDEIPSLKKDTYFDIVTPFDYGAFYYTSDEILEKGLNEFEKKCKAENIISAFLRFNPMIEQNFQIIKKHIECIKLQKHIVIDLQNDYQKDFSKRFFKKKNKKYQKS
jgi:hypothetical protein